jgi:hypothetical protein
MNYPRDIHCFLGECYKESTGGSSCSFDPKAKEICLNFFATSTAAIGNKTPQMRLASMFTIKMPAALPIRNPTPMIPFDMNNHFIARSDFPEKTGAAHRRAMPMKPYPSAANVQKREWGLGAANSQSPAVSLVRRLCLTNVSWM